MRLGEFKPKGSDKTFDEWLDICNGSDYTCGKCKYEDECSKIFAEYVYNMVEILEI